MNNQSHDISMSATRISSYLQCKWKYWCGYVLHFPKKENIAFKLGLAVHSALAKAGRIWKDKMNFSVEDIRAIREEYSVIAAREGIVDMTLYDEGMNMVLNKIEKFTHDKVIAIEEQFRVVADGDVTLIGAMDKVLELQGDSLVVLDYKTSKYFSSAAELKSDIQLSMYDLAASIKYPDYKRIVLGLDYLRDEIVYTYRTIKERKDFNSYLVTIRNEMQRLEEKYAVPTINDMCNWCDYKDQCPAYKDLESLGKSIFKKNLNEYTDDELVEAYLDIKNKNRIMTEYEKQLRSHIMEKINTNGKDLMGSGKHMYIKQNSTTQYSLQTLFDSVPPNDLIRLVSVSKKSVDEYLRNHPELKSKFTVSAQKNYSSPFLYYKSTGKEDTTNE
jgi:RecB family exonuclease